MQIGQTPHILHIENKQSLDHQNVDPGKTIYRKTRISFLWPHDLVISC